MKTFKTVTAAATLAFVLFHFNNCSEKTDSSLFNQLSSSSCLDSKEEVCFSQNSDNLSVGTTFSQIQIQPNQTAINIGGKCNEGGFPLNRIDWQVQDEQSLQVFANSLSEQVPAQATDEESSGIVCGNPGKLSQPSSLPKDGFNNRPGTCIGGQFALNIRLPPEVQGRSLDLKICISGITTESEFVMGGTSFHVDVDPAL